MSPCSIAYRLLSRCLAGPTLAARVNDRGKRPARRWVVRPGFFWTKPARPQTCRDDVGLPEAEADRNARSRIDRRRNVIGRWRRIVRGRLSIVRRGRRGIIARPRIVARWRIDDRRLAIIAMPPMLAPPILLVLPPPMLLVAPSTMLVLVGPCRHAGCESPEETYRCHTQFDRSHDPNPISDAVDPARIPYRNTLIMAVARRSIAPTATSVQTPKHNVQLIERKVWNYIHATVT